ncbi:hypothetical protein [Allorhizocola rhizosphaerae]|uniref:hypothetical protein n=1 Tax=Allorhizocola rhizosphaerae TaxID=1872709 RepID=UPI0013C2BCEF|nr:hypothetical protein [Allorhizocola rhizosphaerae]
MRPLRVLVIAAIAAAAGLALPAQAAAASCAESLPPAAAVFTGTITATDHGGRRATVKTDDGEIVSVVGTPSLDAVATRVDRIYAVGARYEFHTLNASSPFEDNACTNTRQISAAAAMPTTSRSTLVVAFGGGAIVLSGLAVLLAVLWRQRASGGNRAELAT